MKTIKRGDVFYADLSGNAGSEQGGVRPVIVLQNNIGNKYSPCVIVAAITSQTNKAKLPTHVELYSYESGLKKDSVILVEQVRTLDKKRLVDNETGTLRFVCTLSDDKMSEVDKAIWVSFGLYIA